MPNLSPVMILKRRPWRSGNALALAPSLTRHRDGRVGFTLLEIMVTLALIGLLAATLAVAATQMLAKRKTTPEVVFWEAISQARTFALQHECDLWLSFDNQEDTFIATTELGTKTFPLPDGMAFELEFLGMAKGARSIMIGGTLLEANTIKGVRFFGDGTCTPFRAQLVEPGQQPVVFEIDPWTCAPVLRNKEGA